MKLSAVRLQHLINLRRTIHEHPELGYKEYRTAALVEQELQRLEIPYQSAIANTGTGILGNITKGNGPCIMLRADMDALPLSEQTGLAFASKEENVMHACGHDVHTTMLLGAAELLREADFSGTVKFVFQPSEESADAEKKSGGQRIAESSLLSDVSAAIGLHVHPLLPVGQVGYCLGNALACVGCFKITVHGKSAHAGAALHLGVDPIIAANFIIMAVQTIVSRNINPVEPCVFSVTQMQAGSADNIIPDLAILKGTIRALDYEVYKQIQRRLEEILKGICLAFNATYELDYTMNYPSMLNDGSLHQELEAPLEAVFGKHNVRQMAPLLGGEDFAFYSRMFPSMFYLLGAKDTAEETFFVHHPRMIVNEDCIAYGASFLAEAACNLLQKGTSTAP